MMLALGALCWLLLLLLLLQAAVVAIVVVVVVVAVAAAAAAAAAAAGVVVVAVAVVVGGGGVAAVAVLGMLHWRALAAETADLCRRDFRQNLALRYRLQYEKSEQDKHPHCPDLKCVVWSSHTDLRCLVSPTRISSLPSRSFP